MDRVPSSIDDNVKRIINKIKTTEKPIYLDVTPESYAEINECMSSVKQKIEKEGGSVQLGWKIWQIPDIMIEAEFHAVWKSPYGTLKDITPKPENVRRILFVPDSKANYDGSLRNNIRLNISGNRLVDDFIRICDAIYKLKNKGERAYQNKIYLSNEESQVLEMLSHTKALVITMTKNGSSRNSQCICGSGNKYKHCHGKLLDDLLAKV